MIWCVLCWIFYGTFPFDLLGCGENSQSDAYVHVYVHAYVSMRLHVCIFMCICVFVQYIPRNARAVFAVLCFVVVVHWLIFPCPSGSFHWHCGNLTIAPVPGRRPWWIRINTSREFIMNDCIAAAGWSAAEPCACFLGYTVCALLVRWVVSWSQVDYHSTVINVLLVFPLLLALTHYGLLTPLETKICDSTGSGNGLLPDGTNPLPEPVFDF